MTRTLVLAARVAPVVLLGGIALASIALPFWITFEERAGEVALRKLGASFQDWSSRVHVYAPDHYTVWHGNQNANPDFQLGYSRQGLLSTRPEDHSAALQYFAPKAHQCQRTVHRSQDETVSGNKSTRALPD